MLSEIILILFILIAALLVFAQSRPDAFHFERSAAIKAPPEKIFPFINDLHNWPSWSPYEKLDPAMKKTYTGEPSGKGAAFAWQGNAKAGAGSIRIIDTTPPSAIKIKLDMVKPFEGHNQVEFRLQPNPGGADVTWAMDGKYGFPAKLMGLFMNMDNMVGSQFSEGLANLKRLCEQ